MEKPSMARPIPNSIQDLTPEENALLQPHSDEWIKRATDTRRADRAKQEAGIKEYYKLADLPPPKDFLWFDSALPPVIAGPLIAAMQEIVKTYPVIDEKADFEELVTDLISIIRSSWYHTLGGALWSAWPAAVIDFFRKIGCVMENETAAQAAIDVTESWWWWPADTFATITDRPSHLSIDDNHALHSETGPAIQCLDGWYMSFWHGTHIPDGWLSDKENVDPSLALTWQNIEQRRCLCEILTWAKVLEQLNPKIIDVDPNPQIGTLLEVELPDSDGVKDRFLKVQCGTDRTFVIPVDSTVKTALEANASTYGAGGKIDLRKLEFRT